MSAKARNKRFNSIDVFIILLVVLCIAAIYFRGMVASWIGVEKELDEYKITFSVKQIRSTSDKYLIIGGHRLLTVKHSKWLSTWIKTFPECRYKSVDLRNVISAK